MLSAGRLRKPVTIETETRTPNGQGGWDTEWTELARVRAEIVGLTGDEALRAGIERNIQQWRVTIRRRDDVTAEQRLIFKGVRHDIKSVLPDPRAPDEALILICETGAVTGGA